MAVTPDNDNAPDEPMVFIIIGKAYETDGDEDGVDIHVMLKAPDDDTAVREALNAPVSYTHLTLPTILLV